MQIANVIRIVEMIDHDSDMEFFFDYDEVSELNIWTRKIIFGMNTNDMC